MINQFLAKLDGYAEAPADWVWPVTTDALFSDVRERLLGYPLVRELRFLRALELSWFVQQCPFGAQVVADDPRISYRRSDVESRLSASGFVFQYTGPHAAPPSLRFVENPSAQISDFTFKIVGAASQVTISWTGGSLTSPVTMSNGVSNQVPLPGGAGWVIFVGNAPASGDVWSLTYRDANVSWLDTALKLATSDQLAATGHPFALAAMNSPSALDRLAALVVAVARS